MTLALSVFLFGFFLIFVIFIPTRVMLVNLIKDSPFIESLCASISFGILLFTSILIFLRLLGLQFYSFYPLLAIFYIWLYFRRKKLVQLFPSRVNVDFNLIIMIVLIILGTVTQNWFALRSNLETNGAVQFLPFHDASFHLALIGELINFFPPLNPFFSNVPLKNYHFMSDFLVAGISATFKIDILDLYFKLFPLLTSIIYGVMVGIITSNFTKNTWVKFMSIFLAYFAGSFAYLLPLLFGISDWSPLAFLINQPFDIAFNWQNILGFDFFLLGTYLLIKYEANKDIRLTILAAFSFGFLFTFKSYPALVALGAFVIVSIHNLLFKRKINSLIILFIPIAIVSVFSFVFIDTFQNGLKFAPGWILRKMVEDAGSLNRLEWLFQEQYYLENHNTFRLVQLYLTEVIVFIVGNLGVRIIGFIYLLYLVLNVNKLSSSLIFIIASSILSISIPIIFNQGGSPYNIIQFGLYALILSSIFTPIAVERILSNFKIESRKFIVYTCCVLITALAILPTLKQFTSSVKSSLFLVPIGEMTIFDFIKKNVDPNETILLYPSWINTNYAYVSALAQRRTYYAHERQIDLLVLDKTARLEEINQFFTTWSTDEKREFIKRNNITYIYLRSDDQNILGNIQDISKNITIKNPDAMLIKLN